MGGLERPEYCEDIGYEPGNPLNSPEEDQDCQSGIENRSEYYEGEYTPEHTDKSYNAEQDAQQPNFYETFQLMRQSAAAEEARQREEDEIILQQIEDGDFKG